ncbi:TetR/AcrR family transcriptional regulator [Actinomadura sp. GC306]|uniref:TetR/AcrR family transcriptional regulator n=1 Tax=Actinomadura sp. GC306 TaxID=2530367 RepID=UPI00104DF358|nr:TetR/AcrR family transcriptional regulator [Actinomadura sp. GC306]TDC68357.1 TetR/AcrR family transcriptional regulator [Actinomadura sp. GC306]
MDNPLPAVEHGRSTLSVNRPLKESERARRERILAAAHELACGGGYPAATIRAVAERAGTTPATVYRYFPSKDHLLLQLMIDWSEQSIADLTAAAYTGTVPERVAAGFADLIDWAAAELPLLSAVMSAVSSPDISGGGLTIWRELFTALIRAALNEPAWEDTEGKALTLGHVLIACLLDLTTTRTTTEQTRAHITTAARLIFR